MALIASELTPTDPLDAWVPAAGFAPGFLSGVQLSRSWLTRLELNAHQQPIRIAQRTRPRCRVPVSVQAFTDQAIAHADQMARSAMARGLTPLWCDQARVSTSVLAGGVTIPCDPAYRRLFPGGLVFVLSLSRRLEVEALTVLTLDSVGVSSVTTTSPLPFALKPGDRVLPAVVHDPIQTASAVVRGRQHTQREATANEAFGAEQLPGTLGSNQIPAGIQSQHGLPVLPMWPHHDRESVFTGYRERSELYPLGDALIPEAIGTASSGGRTWSVPLSAQTRLEAWQLIQLFDGRRGRRYPLWFVDPVTRFGLVSVGSTSQITVAAVGQPNDWDRRRHLAVRLSDGTVKVAGLASVSRVGEHDVLTLDPPLDALVSVGQVRSVHGAAHCYLASDTMTEQWQPSPGLSRMDTRFELQEDAAAPTALVGFALPAVAPMVTAFAHGVCGGPGGVLDCPDALDWDAHPTAGFAVSFTEPSLCGCLKQHPLTPYSTKPQGPVAGAQQWYFLNLAGGGVYEADALTLPGFIGIDYFDTEGCPGAATTSHPANTVTPFITLDGTALTIGVRVTTNNNLVQPDFALYHSTALTTGLTGKTTSVNQVAFCGTDDQAEPVPSAPWVGAALGGTATVCVRPS